MSRTLNTMPLAIRKRVREGWRCSCGYPIVQAIRMIDISPFNTPDFRAMLCRYCRRANKSG